MILYCNVGYMKNYNGSAYEQPVGGGKYNSEHIGHEVNNFTDCEGTYYGYVQAVSGTIDITKNFDAPENAEYIDGVTIIWTARKKIVGYYLDARVYRKIHHLSSEIAVQREYDDYNIMARRAQLVPHEERSFIIEDKRRNVWYGNEKTNIAVMAYIEEYEAKVHAEEDKISDFTKPLEGYEKEALIKARVNQDVFRDRLMKEYNSACCLSQCCVHTPEMLIASHIKPWSKCNNNEKLSRFNGLLLCPNHDHLFDKGYISFDDDGEIMISDTVDSENRMFMNVMESMNIPVKKEMIPFLKYHRECVFEG